LTIKEKKDPMEVKSEKEAREREALQKKADTARLIRKNAQMNARKKAVMEKKKAAAANYFQALLKPGSAVDKAMNNQPEIRRVVHFPGEQAKTRKPKNRQASLYKQLNDFDTQEAAMQQWCRETMLKNPSLLTSKDPKVIEIIDVIRRHVILIVDATLKRGPAVTLEVWFSLEMEQRHLDIRSLNPLSNAEFRDDLDGLAFTYLSQIDLTMLETAIIEHRIFPQVLRLIIG